MVLDHCFIYPEAVRMYSVKKVILGILQNSLENNCARDSFLIKFFNNVLLKKSLWHRCFPVNFWKFPRTPFSQNTSGGCFHLSKLRMIMRDIANSDLSVKKSAVKLKGTGRKGGQNERLIGVAPHVFPMRIKCFEISSV